jgi:hypothetical protein
VLAARPKIVIVPSAEGAIQEAYQALTTALDYCS